MAGLNNLLSDTMQTTTTLPAWYDAAQQQVVGQGVGAFNQAPQMGQTVAQGAINQLQPGQANPFTQAQSSLQQISSGAANPWITDSSGQVAPNTNTALGGLFAAQNQQLQQLMPNVTAPVQGANIASGNFGSLRGQTAYDKAMGDAIAQMNAQQMNAALQNQSTGVQGAAQLGNVTQQGINAAMNVGQAQQNAPFTNVGNLASLLSTIKAPTTESTQKQLSPLGQISTVGNALLGGAKGLEAFGKTKMGESILKQIPSLKSALGSIGGGGVGSIGGQLIGTDQATQDFIKEHPGFTPRDEDGNLLPGWESNANGSVSWTGDIDAGGDYVGPDYGTNDNFDDSFYDTNSYD
jgi:hypothetical protein